MTKKVTKKSKGLVPTMVQKSEKVKEYIYVLSNGIEITFNDKIFPDGTKLSNQLELF